MEQWLLSLLQSVDLYYAAILSVMISIIIAVVGVIPSITVTTANVFIFGIVNGFIISFIGEVAGAQVAFYLYRKGLKKPVRKRIDQTWVKNWLEKGKNVNFTIVLQGRLIPFVPASLVTFYASIGSMNGISFFIASTLGKIPPMMIETLTAYGILQSSESLWQLLIAFIILMIFIYYYRKEKG